MARNHFKCVEFVKNSWNGEVIINKSVQKNHQKLPTIIKIDIENKLQP